jgi:TatD DNase family protein
MRLHDTHCHLDLYQDRAALLEEIERLGIYTIAVTNAPSVFHLTEQLTEGKRFVRPALGLHPELVASHGHELDLFEELLPSTKYIGEVGLDYTHTTQEERVVQRRVFERILILAHDAGGRIVTVHSRGAADDVITMALANEPGPFILHWFSGNAKALFRVNEAGLWLSVNPAMGRTLQGRRRIAAFRQDRVLLESDGPFIEVRGEPARPRHGEEVVRFIAQEWRMTPEEVALRLQNNLRSCLTSIYQN